jgi:DNA-binding NarL/FixJ family response regulator
MDDTRGIAEALLNGRMRLVSRDDDGSGGSVLTFEAGHVPLGRRERAVLAASESGAANKLVAIEQSLACSTVSEALNAALSKIGFKGRAEFLRVMAYLRSGSPAVRLVGTSEPLGSGPQKTPRRRLFVPLEAVAPDPSLTSAERQVVEHVLSGRSNAAIARARSTSSRTVANQLAAIYRKLGVSSRWELAARCSLAHCA